MKTIMPLKLVIDVVDGDMSRATLLYKINTDGAVSGTKSVRVTVSDTSQIIADAKASAESSEGL